VSSWTLRCSRPAACGRDACIGGSQRRRGDLREPPSQPRRGQETRRMSLFVIPRQSISGPKDGSRGDEPLRRVDVVRRTRVRPEQRHDRGASAASCAPSRLPSRRSFTSRALELTHALGESACGDVAACLFVAHEAVIDDVALALGQAPSPAEGRRTRRRARGGEVVVHRLVLVGRS